MREAHRLLSLGVACALFAPTRARAADDDKARCVEAYEDGQRARKHGRLLSAQQSFSLCASDVCPVVMHADCSRWSEELDPQVPRVTIELSDPDDNTLDGARLSLDLGEERSLDEEPIRLDPGQHSLTLRRDGYRDSRQQVAVARSDRLKLHVVLEPVSTPPSVTPPPVASAPRRLASPADSGGPSLLPALVAGGVGLAGVASFAYFGLSARSEDRALDGCSPHCSVESTERIRRDYLLGNVSLGVGLASLTVAGAWLVLAPRPERQSAARAFEIMPGPVTWVRHRF
jgi:hypothetical protein